MELPDEVRKILDGVNPGVLATLNADGSPQTSVVWLKREGHDIVLSSESGRRKLRNIARDPRVSLSVYDLQDPSLYVEFRGVATVAEDQGRALAVALADQYEGHPAGQEYLALPQDVVRVIIRITVSHLSGSAT